MNYSIPKLQNVKYHVPLGRYPDLVGVPGVIRGVKDQSWGYLCEDAITLPDILNKAGYETALIGKWHLGQRAAYLPASFLHFANLLSNDSNPKGSRLVILKDGNIRN